MNFCSRLIRDLTLTEPTSTTGTNADIGSWELAGLELDARIPI